jgi:hypothetical protein
MTKVKEFFLYLFCFIIVIQIGFLLTEYVKIITASLLGFSHEFRPILGLTMFYPETELMEPFYTHQLNKIEISGLVFTHLVSLIGLITLWIRRKTLFTNQSIMDLLLAIMSLFFMRDIIYPGIFVLFNFIPCQAYELYKSLPLNGFLLLRIHFFLGLMMLGFVVWILPSNKRLIFILSGALASVISFFMIVKFTHLLL